MSSNLRDRLLRIVPTGAVGVPDGKDILDSSLPEETISNISDRWMDNEEYNKNGPQDESSYSNRMVFKECFSPDEESDRFALPDQEISQIRGTRKQNVENSSDACGDVSIPPQQNLQYIPAFKRARVRDARSAVVLTSKSQPEIFAENPSLDGRKVEAPGKAKHGHFSEGDRKKHADRQARRLAHYNACRDYATEHEAEYRRREALTTRQRLKEDRSRKLDLIPNRDEPCPPLSKYMFEYVSKYV